uniref:Uncharacterized protein n=1 Tax=Roseihalotalea indica TaxID=2867963 RepID=A0AA49GPG8_9BACT|nr:hypothetical protein K4G66_02120 [Tunicatimonas sp. TK19036]
MSSKFDPTQPLFKYTDEYPPDKKYATGMLQHGILKIGTLHDFRKVEDYNYTIGDIYEGRSQFIDHIDHTEGRKIKKPPLVNSSKKTIVTIKNSFNAYDVDSQDFYIFCVTIGHSTKGMQKTGYNASVRINNPMEFMRIITQELIGQGLITGECWIDACMYGERHRSLKEVQNIPVFFLKSTDFEYQKEVRMVWAPTESSIGHKIIECPAIAKLLSLQELLPKIEKPNLSYSPRLKDEELLKKTYEVVDSIIEYLQKYKDTEEQNSSDSISFKNGSQTLSELQEKYKAGPFMEKDLLIKEYANRGFRDGRLERIILPHAGLNEKELASTLQRLAELFEIRLAVNDNKFLKIERASEYRFWARNFDMPIFMFAEKAPELILQAYKDEKKFTAGSDKPESTLSIEPYSLKLSPEVRKALAWFVKNSGATPSEVMDELQQTIR